MAHYQVRSPAAFQQACDRAVPGDVIEISPGLYKKKTLLKDKEGITIRPARQGLIDGCSKPDPYLGGTLPHRDAPSKPIADDFAFLQIINSRNIFVDGLTLENFWPVIFFIKKSSMIAIRRCSMKHGTFAIFVKGEAAADNQADDTRGFLIEDNVWQQDDTADHKLWSEYDWREAHGGEGSSGLLRYFNGGFFGAKSIVGDVVIRRNKIVDAYNGIRIKASDAPPPNGQLPRLNANVHVYENDFIRIRDNPTEPEVYAVDWHVRHNRLFNCHTWFSFDGIAGGYWYYYGNTGGFDSRQGISNRDQHTMGRVLKLSYETFNDPSSYSHLMPTHPWYVFNNSWHLRCPLIGGNDPTRDYPFESNDFTSHLQFFNNAIEWCDPRWNAPGVCQMTDLVMKYDWNRGTAVTFDYDLCNRSDFKFFLARPNQLGEPHGIIAKGPVFMDGAGQNFRLDPASGGSSAGALRELATSTGRPARLRSDEGNCLNIGAVQLYGLISVPDLENRVDALERDFGWEGSKATETR